MKYHSLNKKSTSSSSIRYLEVYWRIAILIRVLAFRTKDIGCYNQLIVIMVRVSTFKIKVVRRYNWLITQCLECLLSKRKILDLKLAESILVRVFAFRTKDSGLNSLSSHVKDYKNCNCTTLDINK